MRALVWAVAAASVLAVGGQAQAAERMLTWTLESRYLDPEREPFNGPPPGAPARPNRLRANVLLPDGYNGRRRFPVLYLLHGHGDAYDYWANPHRGDAGEVARGLGAIVVMPEGARGWYVDWWRGGTRRPGWESHHLRELIPLVERRLRIRRGRRWRAIAGLSMGGEGALYYAAQRPGYFGSAASFSGSISIQRPEWPAAMDSAGERHVDVFGDPSAQRFYWEGHNPTALARNLEHTRLYVTAGDGVPGSFEESGNIVGQLAEIQLRQQAQEFVHAAQRVDARVTYRPRQGIHDWPYWREHLRDAIAWGFFKRVGSAPAHWSYATASPVGDAWGFRYRFEPAPTRVHTLSRSGNRLSATGSGRVQLRTPGGCRVSRPLPAHLRLAPRCESPRRLPE